MLSFIKAAVKYYLSQYPAYTYESLTYHQPALTHSTEYKDPRSIATDHGTEGISVPTLDKRLKGTPPCNGNRREAETVNDGTQLKTSESDAMLRVRAKKPAQTASARVVSRSTERVRTSSTTRSSRYTPEVQKQPSRRGDLSSTATMSTTVYPAKAQYNHVQSRYKQTLTPQRDRQQSLDRSFDNLHSKHSSVTASTVSVRRALLRERAEQLLGDRTTTISPAPNRPALSRSQNSQQRLNEDIAARVAIYQETDEHRKSARHYRSKTTRLLVDQDRKVLFSV